MSEWGVMASGEELVDVGLGVPVFVAVAGVAAEAVVAESFQIAVFDSEKRHEGFQTSSVAVWRNSSCRKTIFRRIILGDEIWPRKLFYG